MQCFPNIIVSVSNLVFKKMDPNSFILSHCSLKISYFYFYLFILLSTAKKEYLIFNFYILYSIKTQCGEILMPLLQANNILQYFFIKRRRYENEPPVWKVIKSSFCVCHLSATRQRKHYGTRNKHRILSDTFVNTHQISWSMSHLLWLKSN